MAQSYPRRRARYFSRSLQFHLARQVAVVRIYNFATIARVMAIDDSLKRLLRFLFTLDWRGGVARGKAQPTPTSLRPRRALRGAVCL